MRKALELFLKAGVGNSTDFALQIEATKLAKEVLAAKPVDTAAEVLAELRSVLGTDGEVYRKVEQLLGGGAVEWTPATTLPLAGELVRTNVGVAYVSRAKPGVWFKWLEGLGMGQRLGVGAVKQWRVL